MAVTTDDFAFRDSESSMSFGHTTNGNVSQFWQMGWDNRNASSKMSLLSPNPMHLFYRNKVNREIEDYLNLFWEPI